MKRFSLITLFFLTLTLSASAFKDPNYSNLEFTVLDTEAKTVSVKAVNRTNYYTATDTLIIPDTATDSESGLKYTVTEVAEDGFKAISIAHISLPNTLKHIHYQAFRSISTPFTCPLNEGLNIIGDRAFCQSTGLTGDLVIPATVDSISTHVFFNCYNVNKIIVLNETPCKLQAAVSFMCADSKTPITTKLYVPCGTYATYRSTSIWKALAWNSTCETIEDGIVYELLTDSTAMISGLSGTLPTELVFKDSISIFEKNRAITEIKEGAFYRKPGDIEVSKIVLPKHLKIIGKEALRNITSSFTLTLNDELEVIGNRAFCQSTGLMGNLIIPASVDSIYEYAFYNCTNLTSIQVNTTIVPYLQSKNAFTDATNSLPLSDISVLCGLGNTFRNDKIWNQLTIQDECEIIDNGIRYLKISETDLKLLSYVDKADARKDLIIPGSITSESKQTFTVTELAENCFYRNSSITSVTIPNTVKTIGNCAFYQCTELQSLLLYEGLQVIGDSTFTNCSSLKSVTVPTSVQIIGNRTFYQCTGMQSLTLSEGIKVIGNRSFTRCISLDSLIIPSTVTYIDDAAFYDCTGLTSLEILAEEPPALFANNVFQNIPVAITIPCGTYSTYQNSSYWVAFKLIDPCNNSFIHESFVYSVIAKSIVETDPDTVCLEGCIGTIEDLDIKRSFVYKEKSYIIKKIKNYAFSNNTGITSLHIPSSVDSVGDYAFQKCSGLVNIKIDNGVAHLGDYSFYNCSSVESVSMDEGLLSIGNRCFAHCTKITTLTLPSTLQTIDDYAFFNCYSVKQYHFLSTTPPTLKGAYVFGVKPEETAKLEKFVIPCGSMDSYKNANYWKDLSSKFVSACKPLTLKKGEELTQEDTIVSSIAYRRTFDMDVWQTLYLPFEVDSVLVYDEQDAKYYDINYPFKPGYGGYFYLNKYENTNVEEATITFTTADTLKGNNAYLIQFPTTDDRYFEGKDIVFKSTAGEYTLNKLDYSQPKATTQFEVSGNSSVYNQSVSDMYIFRATHVTGKDGKDSVKYEFNRQASDTLKPFEFGLLPYVVEPSSGISSAPMRMSLRIGRSSGNTGGGDITTSVSETHAPNAITYRTGAGELALSLNGLPCQLYSVSGTLLYSSAGGTEEITIPLEKGIYILYSEGKSQKIVL